MYALLELYARPKSKAEPVICIDEKSLQLITHSRSPLPMAASSPIKHDYEYVRNGTTNLFVAVEPKGELPVLASRKHDFGKKIADRIANIVIAAVADNPDPIADFLFTVLTQPKTAGDSDFLGI
jgi:hypothetical protein